MRYMIEINLSNRVAVITGGSGALGRVMVRTLCPQPEQILLSAIIKMKSWRNDYWGKSKHWACAG